MKKSEFKEYLKTEILRMHEASQEDVEVQKELNAELEKTKELTSDMEKMNESRVKKSDFKKYLRTEILREINEADEETDIETDAEEADAPAEDENELDAETFNFDEPSFGEAGEGDVDAITDELVKLAKDAKNAGQMELANQILNSAKFSAKTEFKKVEKEA